ncbi:MAG: DUF4198 domain-containing protein [Pirellulales bacterium]
MSLTLHSFVKLPLAASLALCLVALIHSSTRAHDAWVEANTPLVRTGDVVHLDLKLGNHGNNHRDFKLAGRLNPDWTAWDVVTPSGARKSLKTTASATAAGDKEGYWTTPFLADEEGVYTVVQSLERVMNHGKPVRGIRSAKTLFISSKSLDNPKCDLAAAHKPQGLPFELVLDSCPLQGLGAERPLKVRLLKNGKPAAGVVVSFIPRGAKLADDFDADYERKTDAEGRAVFTPKAGNLYLVVAHFNAEDEKSAEYEYTSYAATLTVHVPQKCACCLE